MIETDKAYIAGIIDGEGTIGIWKNHQGLQPGRRTPSFVLRVRVKMTTEFIVRWLHSSCGGRFYTTNKVQENHKPIYDWSIAGREAVKFLKEIYPYLKLKGPQAELAFKFVDTMQWTQGWMAKPLTKEVVEKRENLRSQMLILNKRGLN